MSIALTVSHQIVSMTAGLTKGSQSPMWRCQTSDGERVNAFKHTDPVRNTFALFADAGYAFEMLAMVDGQQVGWKNAPIGVVMIRDGQWWQIVGVQPRPEGTRPDPTFTPDPALYRGMAVDWAKWLLSARPTPLFFDTETTGTTKDDEIISIAALNRYGDTALKSLVKPTDMSRVESCLSIHHITVEMLENAPTFPELYESINAVLGGAVWIAYNAEFDVRMLEQDCIRHSLRPIANIGVNCAMKLFAKWYGEWDVQRQDYRYKALGFAAEHMGLDFTEAHEALVDSITTLELVRAIAMWQPGEQPQPADHENSI
jgi:DNA polymerase-3 subunit epsilon